MYFVLFKIVTVPQGRKFTITKKSQIFFEEESGDDLSTYNDLFVGEVTEGNDSTRKVIFTKGNEYTAHPAGNDCVVRLTKI